MFNIVNFPHSQYLLDVYHQILNNLTLDEFYSILDWTDDCENLTINDIDLCFISVLEFILRIKQRHIEAGIDIDGFNELVEKLRYVYVIKVIQKRYDYYN